jgi:tryptophanyl-tRNA synthetase
MIPTKEKQVKLQESYTLSFVFADYHKNGSCNHQQSTINNQQSEDIAKLLIAILKAIKKSH